MSTALVLAGGGVTGIAWETGVLRGLRERGLDLAASADLIVGTSAGSTVGAQLATGRDIDDMFAAQLDEAHNEISPRLDLDLLATIFGMLEEGGTRDDARRAEIGALALTASTVDEPTRRAVIESRVGTDAWPARNLVVTAIDAVTGSFVTWDRTVGVSLVDAVASSCAVPGVWPCVTINSRR